MSKTKKYANILSEFLFQFEKKFENSSDGLITISIIDENRHHYQSVVYGFSDEKFVFIVQFHFDIINEKVWVQRNVTDIDLGEELINKGIPKSDIVIGFLSDDERAYSGYGIDKEMMA